VSGPLGLYGGSFDPPHRGHVELARRAKAQFGLHSLLVLVSSDPGHKHVDTPVDVRLRLAQAAFPDDEVVLDEHPRTIDLLRAHPEWADPIFLIGADQFRSFLAWKEPNEVLRRTRLAVATRPGFPHEELEPVLAQLEQPERVLFFEIEPAAVASRELRERLASGDEIGPEVPPAVGALIRSEGLYRHR
jgi:nicotinate-nucleotide adenylyltransferase